MTGLPSGMPEMVDDGEPVIRFAFSRKKEMWVAEPPGHLKPAAFFPDARGWPETKHHLETSVFRHGGEPVEELLQLAADNFPDREPKGAGLVLVRPIRQAGLDVVADEKPPSGPRHANIVDWAEDADPKVAKATWKQQAMMFAGQSKLVWQREE